MNVTPPYSKTLVIAFAVAAVVLATVGGAVGADQPEMHEQANCSLCHGLGADALRFSDAVRAETCAGCHAAGRSAQWQPSAFHDGGEDRCTVCHCFHDARSVRLPGSTGSITGVLAALPRTAADTNDLAACKPCHPTGGPGPELLSAGHRAAGAWYHSHVAEVASQPISESCLRCHDAQQALPTELEGGFDPPRPHVHASHPFGIRAIGIEHGGFGIRESIDPRLVLVDGLIECTTCHDLHQSEDDLLVRFESAGALCLGCHQRVTGPGFAGAEVVLSR